MLSVLAFICTIITLSHSLRCHSTTWRNANNQVVKKINYGKNLIFTTETVAENKERDALSYGWIYNAFLENDTITYKKIQIIKDVATKQY